MIMTPFYSGISEILYPAAYYNNISYSYVAYTNQCHFMNLLKFHKMSELIVNHGCHGNKCTKTFIMIMSLSWHQLHSVLYCLIFVQFNQEACVCASSQCHDCHSETIQSQLLMLTSQRFIAAFSVSQSNSSELPFNMDRETDTQLKLQCMMAQCHIIENDNYSL